MNEMKWYRKLLIGLNSIILSPIILAFIIFAGIYFLFKYPKMKKEYKKSQYYLDLKQKFMASLIDSPEYRFYNSAIHRKLPIKYIKQESNGFEYFIFKGTIYLFPNFEQIDYDDENGRWQVDCDGDWRDFEDTYNSLLAKIDELPTIPVKIIIERKMFPLVNLSDVSIPKCIFLTWEYEEAFENEDSPLKMLIPQSSKELYKMMLQTPNLCGHFELSSDGEYILWDLYENIRINIGVTPEDCYLGISKMHSSKFERELTHFHPTAFEIYNEVSKLGKQGNVMIVRTYASGGGVLYMGNKENCPYPQGKRYLFGKLYYLEAKKFQNQL